MLWSALHWMALHVLVRRPKPDRSRDLRHQRRRFELEMLEDRTLLSYNFTLITDNTGPFQSLLTTPSITSQGTVVLDAPLKIGGEVIATGDGGTLNLVAVTNDLFQAFQVAPHANDSGAVSFRSTLRDGTQGLFTSDGRELIRIADNGADSPFSGFPEPPRTVHLNNAGTVAFRASLRSGGSGVFTGDGGAPRVLYVTGGAWSDFVRGPGINDAGTVAFLGELTGGGQAIAKGDGGPVTVIADTSGPIASFPLSNRCRINNAGEVVFVADLKDGREAVMTGDGERLTTVADTDGPFRTFNFVALNQQGDVVFDATLNDGTRGYFKGPDPVADKILAVGDPLFGQNVGALGGFAVDALNDAGQLAFLATLTDGTQTIGRADPEGSGVEGSHPVRSFVGMFSTIVPDISPSVKTGLSGPQTRWADVSTAQDRAWPVTVGPGAYVGSSCPSPTERTVSPASERAHPVDPVFADLPEDSFELTADRDPVRVMAR